MKVTFARTMGDAQDEAWSRAIATDIPHRITLCRLCDGVSRHFIIKPADRVPASVLA